MKRRRALARLRASVLAAGIGWATAALATLPIPLFKVWTNAIGGWRSLIWSLGAGALVWLSWTLAIAANAWLFGALPAAILVPEAWLIEKKRQAIAISAALAWLVVLIQFHFWRFLSDDYYLDVRLFMLYSLWFVIFASITTVVYLRLAARSRASDARRSAPGGA